jgi:hypothetical protein
MHWEFWAQFPYSKSAFLQCPISRTGLSDTREHETIYHQLISETFSYCDQTRIRGIPTPYEIRCQTVWFTCEASEAPFPCACHSATWLSRGCRVRPTSKAKCPTLPRCVFVLLMVYWKVEPLQYYYFFQNYCEELSPENISLSSNVVRWLRFRQIGLEE